MLRLQQFSGDFLAGDRSGFRALQLYDQMIVDLQIKIAGGLYDGLPAKLCI